MTTTDTQQAAGSLAAARQITPLSPAEERVWRAIARALVTVPRALDTELEREAHLTMGEYFVLVNLSEAPERSLRMSEIAVRGGLSPSRISRVIDAMVADGLVVRRRGEGDGRVQIATLTDAGLARLEAAYPAHLASVRRNVVDHLHGLDLDRLAEAVSQFAPSCAVPAQDVC